MLDLVASRNAEKPAGEKQDEALARLTGQQGARLQFDGPTSNLQKWDVLVAPQSAS